MFLQIAGCLSEVFQISGLSEIFEIFEISRISQISSQPTRVLAGVPGIFVQSVMLV